MRNLIFAIESSSEAAGVGVIRVIRVSRVIGEALRGQYGGAIESSSEAAGVGKGSARDDRCADRATGAEAKAKPATAAVVAAAALPNARLAAVWQCTHSDAASGCAARGARP